jgi:hypothetical protein
MSPLRWHTSTVEQSRVEYSSAVRSTAVQDGVELKEARWVAMVLLTTMRLMQPRRGVVWCGVEWCGVE